MQAPFLDVDPLDADPSMDADPLDAEALCMKTPPPGCRPLPLDADPDSLDADQRLAGGGGKKHEIYVVAFGGHLFYDLFLQGKEGHDPLGPPPWIRYCPPDADPP